MGYTWRSNTDGTADAVECEEFAEVVYENDQVLVVNVASGMLPHRGLEDALVDALALHEARHGAQHAIGTVADAFGLEVHPQGDDGYLALTVGPATAGPAGSGVRGT